MHRLLCVFTLFVAIVSGATELTSAQDAIPPVRKLLTETLAPCNVDRENNTSALNDLAAAQCYLRDFAAARKTLVPYTPDDIIQLSAHHKCARIEIELTGSTADIPATLWSDEFGFMPYEATLAFIDRGDFDKAFDHFEKIPKSEPGIFGLFGPTLVSKLQAAQQIDRCRQVLLSWAACYDNANSLFQYRNGNHFPRLIAWLIEFDARPNATSLCERLHSIVKKETDVHERGESIGRCWAEYALAVAALGDKPAAEQALQQAREWIDKAFTAKFDPEFARLRYHEFARCYAAIAARQAVVLGDEIAQPTYSRAFELAHLTVDRQYGEYTYEQIVVEQLAAGEEKSARQTIRRMASPQYIARMWRVICAHDLAHARPDSARAAAREAVGWLMNNDFEPHIVHEMAKVAATAANADEKELAQKLFHRALALSEKHEDPKSYHDWIASHQVHAGLLADAYQTIQSIPDESDRLKPQAQLCLALAKAEHLAGKAPRR